LAGGSSGGTGPASGAEGAEGAAGPSREAAVGASPDALAIEVGAFCATFERWANRKAVDVGASVPRLRLLYEVHCHGPQKMATLAEALAVTPRNVTALVDGLEADGLVRRVPHSTDRRITLVELTCNSDHVAEKFGTYQASVAGLFDGLTAGDRETLLRLLETLHGRMHADAGCSAGEKGASDA
jgi:DNA-binding MarR family transcriptional regulator